MDFWDDKSFCLFLWSHGFFFFFITFNVYNLKIYLKLTLCTLHYILYYLYYILYFLYYILYYLYYILYYYVLILLLFSLLTV